MRQHQSLFDAVRKHPAMYLQQESFAAVTAFVQGFDFACEGGLLAGFREWLVVRLGAGSNLGWPALVLHASFPGAASPQDVLASGADAAQERVAIDTLFDLLSSFDEVRERHGGLRKIFSSYEAFLAERDGGA